MSAFVKLLHLMLHAAVVFVEPVKVVVSHWQYARRPHVADSLKDVQGLTLRHRCSTRSQEGARAVHAVALVPAAVQPVATHKEASANHRQPLPEVSVVFPTQDTESVDELQVLAANAKKVEGEEDEEEEGTTKVAAVAAAAERKTSFSGTAIFFRGLLYLVGGKNTRKKVSYEWGFF